MVSSVLDLTDEEVAEELRRMAKTYADDPDWQAFREEMPEEWPF